MLNQENKAWRNAGGKCVAGTRDKCADGTLLAVSALYTTKHQLLPVWNSEIKNAPFQITV